MEEVQVTTMARDDMYLYCVGFSTRSHHVISKRCMLILSHWQEPRGENVVGFKDATTTLINYLNEKSDKLEVISIIGMPGLGKTTLAWKIYKDEAIEREFTFRIWVYVSEELNKKDLLLNILKTFYKNKDNSSKSIEDLIADVKKCLQKRKFLIVMDDVWTRDAWDVIKEVLPMSNKVSKVLITSRHDFVATHAKSSRPHKLRLRTEEESWELLQLEVYGTDSFPEDLKPVGKEIAKNCKGLPLSIIIIAGVLHSKLSTTEGDPYHTRREWEKVATNVESYLKKGDGKQQLENIIKLSYHQLSDDTRDCFLYLGIFPEDSEIPACKLIQLWMAEGFIQQKENMSMEEIAHDNLKDFISRNLVMVEKQKPDGEVKSCRIHDTIRGFCKTEAAFDRQHLYQEIRMSKDGVFEPKIENNGRPFRRLCINSDVHKFLLKEIASSKTRSFLCFSNGFILLEGCEKFIIDRFILIRVMDAVKCRFPTFPLNLTQLTLLRYLTLVVDDCEALPVSISQLWNLQTLIVYTNSDILKIPVDIWKLMQLRYLKTKLSTIMNIESGSNNGDGGENLQTLSRLSPESCTNGVFEKARNIKTLGICGDLNKLMNSNCLEELHRLDKLKLVQESGVFSDLPQSRRFPPKVRILVLCGTRLKWADMSILGELGNLEVLKLKERAFKGELWHVNGGFSRLEFLYISETNLQSWTTSVDSFPKLRTVEIKDCDKLKEVPLALAKSLNKLSMEGVTESAVRSAEKIKEAKQGGQTGRARGFKLVIAFGDQLQNQLPVTVGGGQ